MRFFKRDALIMKRIIGWHRGVLSNTMQILNYYSFWGTPLIKNPNSITIYTIKTTTRYVAFAYRIALLRSDPPFQFLAPVETREFPRSLASRLAEWEGIGTKNRTLWREPPPPELRSGDRRAARTAGRVDCCCCYQTVITQHNTHDRHATPISSRSYTRVRFNFWIMTRPWESSGGVVEPTVF